MASPINLGNVAVDLLAEEELGLHELGEDERSAYLAAQAERLSPRLGTLLCDFVEHEVQTIDEWRCAIATARRR